VQSIRGFKTAGRLAIIAAIFSSGFQASALAQLNCNGNTSTNNVLDWGIINTPVNGVPTGGTAPYSYEFAPGSTPLPGFQLTKLGEVGQLRGILATPGTYSATIRCRDANNLTQDFTYQFRLPSLQTVGGFDGEYSVGESLPTRMRATNPGTTFSLAPGSPALPPGITLNPDGTFSGTFTTPGSYSIFVRGTAPNTDTADRFYGTVTVKAVRFTNNIPLRTLPVATVGQFYSFNFTASGGTAPYTFSFAGGGANGLSINSSGTLSGTPSSTNYNLNFSVVVTDFTGTTLTRRFAVPCLPATPTAVPQFSGSLSTGTIGNFYFSNLFVTGGTPPYTYDLEPGSNLPQGAFLINPSEWNNLNDASPASVRAVVQTAGTYNFTVRVTDSAGVQFSQPLQLTFVNLGALTTTLPTATYGVPYNFDLLFIGGRPPYTVLADTLPAGLNLSGAGVLSGTPLETGSVPVNFTIVDQDGQRISLARTLQINGPGGATPINCGGNAFATASLGRVYTWFFTCSGSPLGSPNFTLSLESGSLPPGMSLVPKETSTVAVGSATLAGGYAGTPTQTGTYTALIRITDAGGNVGFRQIRMRIVDLAIQTFTLRNGSVGLAYSFPIVLSGTTAGVRCLISSGGLPTGVSLNADTCILSGTPTSRGVFNFTLQLVDPSGNVLLTSSNFAITIFGLGIQSPLVLPTATWGQPYSTTLTSNPGVPVVWSTNSFLGGLTLNASTGVLSGTPTVQSGITIAMTARFGIDFVTQSVFLPVKFSANEAFLNLPTKDLGRVQTGSGSTQFFISGGTPPYSVSLAPGSALPPGLVIGDYNSIMTTLVPGSTLGLIGGATTPGNYTFTLRYSDSGGVTVDRIHQMSVTSFGLIANSLPNMAVNQPFSFQLSIGAGNGSAVYSLGSTSNVTNNFLPAGLSLSSSGLISGTPLIIGGGSFTPTINITSGGVTRNQIIGLNVYASLSPLRRMQASPISPISAGDPIVGQYIFRNGNFLGGSGTHTFSIVSGSLPPGLVLTTNTNGTYSIAGVATTAGNYLLRLRANDATGNFGIVDIPIVVTPLNVGPLNLAAGGFLTTPIARQGVPYSFQFTGLGGRPPYTFIAEASSILPNGLTLSPSGLLTGTPVEGGNASLSLLLTDADGRTRRQSVTIQITSNTFQIGPILQNGLLRPASVGSPYTKILNETLRPGLGSPPYSWTLESGVLPAGITLIPAVGTTSAQLSGIPTTAGTISFTLRCTDANGKFITSSFGLVTSAVSLDPNLSILSPAVVGVPFSLTLTPGGSSGTEALVSVGDIPPGLNLNTTTGILSGTPTQEGVFILNLAPYLSTNPFYRYVLPVAASGTTPNSLSVSPATISTAYVLGAAAPAPIPLSISSSAGPLAYTASTSGGAWLSLSPTIGSTPAAPNLTLNPVGLPAGTYNGAVTINSVGATNGPLVIPVSLTVQANAVCGYSLTPENATATRFAGSISVSVSTFPSCIWTATSNDAWITVRPPSVGSGSAAILLDFTENTGATRSGTVTIGGRTYTLTQFGSTCDYTAVVAAPIVSSGGGVNLLQVAAPSSSCSWSPVSSQPWITFPSPGPFTGSANVTFQVGNITASTSRSATITVGGTVVTVNQSGLGCTYVLSSSTGSVSSGGGSLNFSLNTGADCAWTFNPGAAWVEYIGPSSGTGPASFPLTVTANSTLSTRSTTLVVVGRPFTINQTGLPCSYSLSESNPVFSSAGGSNVGSINIGSTGAGCGWTITPSAPWLTPASASGSGTSTVSFSVAANPDASARSAKLIIAGQQVNVSQAGTTCSFQLLNSSAAAPALGTNSFVRVATANACSFSAVSNAAWIVLTSSSFSGTSNVNFTVQANPSATARSGTLTIAGQSFAVTQAAAPCSVVLGSTTFSAGAFGGANVFNFTTSTPDCNPIVQSFNSWLVVSSSTFNNGSGSVNFTIDANNFSTTRVGTIKVGLSTFNVIQAASPCAYTLATSSLQFSKLPTSSQVDIPFGPSQCAAPPVGVNAPFGMISLTGLSLTAPSTYRQTFNVGEYLSLINATRSAQITIGGQILNVKQRSW
jgi:hypothetical protein